MSDLCIMIDPPKLGDDRQVIGLIDGNDLEVIFFSEAGDLLSSPDDVHNMRQRLSVAHNLKSPSKGRSEMAALLGYVPEFTGLTQPIDEAMLRLAIGRRRKEIPRHTDVALTESIPEAVIDTLFDQPLNEGPFGVGGDLSATDDLSKTSEVDHARAGRIISRAIAETSDDIDELLKRLSDIEGVDDALLSEDEVKAAGLPSADGGAADAATPSGGIVEILIRQSQDGSLVKDGPSVESFWDEVTSAISEGHHHAPQEPQDTAPTQPCTSDGAAKNAPHSFTMMALQSQIDALTAENKMLKARLESSESQKRDSLKAFKGIFSWSGFENPMFYGSGSHRHPETHDLQVKVVSRINALIDLSALDGRFGGYGFDLDEPNQIVHKALEQAYHALFPERDPGVSAEERLAWRARELRFLDASVRNYAADLSSMFQDGVKIAEKDLGEQREGVHSAVLFALRHYKSLAENLAPRVPELDQPVSIDVVRTGLTSRGKKGVWSDLIGLMPDDVFGMNGVGPATFQKLENKLEDLGLPLDPLKGWRQYRATDKCRRMGDGFTHLSREVFSDLGFDRAPGGSEVLQALLNVVASEVSTRNMKRWQVH